MALPVLMVAVAQREGAGAPLTFDRRVELEERLEHVMDAHRTWPKENPAAKPPYEQRVRREAIEARVQLYLRKSAALSTFWQRTVTEKQIQREVERMARGTRDPDLLRELFHALGDDPYLIAECLGRPSLASQEFAQLYPRCARIHGATRESAERAGSTLAADLAGTPGFESSTYVLKSSERAPAGTIAMSAADLDRLRSALPGVAAPVEEKDDAFVIRRVACDEGDRLTIDSIRFPKRSPESWLADASLGDLGDAWREPPSNPSAFSAVTVTTGMGGSSSPGSAPYVDASTEYSSTWTGTEMFVIAGGGEPSLVGAYNPATDTWRVVTPPVAPLFQYSTATWTGSEVIVFADGFEGRYDPRTDTWRPMSSVNMPSIRLGHTAVWTGTEMVIWGGYWNTGTALNDGGRYDPTTDTWRATSVGAGVPSARAAHTAVWTGSEMIVWGGYLSGNTGGRYNPVTDAWTPTSTQGFVPAYRVGHSAVWTGTHMIIWGGLDNNTNTAYDTGGSYDPIADQWTPTSTGVGVPTPRGGHGAVWTGADMLVWGGARDDGARYDPLANSWTPISLLDAPTGLVPRATLWTGHLMIVWGGWPTGVNGGLYDPTSDTWHPTSMGGFVPASHYDATAVWTGTELIVWGGQDVGSSYGQFNSGARYTLATDSWEPTSTGNNVPPPRYFHSAVWTGSEMIIFGGYGGVGVSGAAYDPATDSWGRIAAGSRRAFHTAVWTGREMIVWGGEAGNLALDDGARYDPSTDSWTPIAPDVKTGGRRTWHSAIWTGSEMIVWGGDDGYSSMNTGARYDPTAGSWKPTSLVNAPVKRELHAGVWTGTEMIIWGGRHVLVDEQTGGRYDPITDTWRATSLGAGVPSGRYLLTGVWTGDEMVVWGGQNLYNQGGLNTGGRYNPVSDVWVPTTTVGAPGRTRHAAVWTPPWMLVWGGSQGIGRTLGRYRPSTDTWESGWPGLPPLGEDVVVAKPQGDGTSFYPAAARGYRVDGALTPTLLDAFPSYVGRGASPGVADVEPGGREELLMAPGPGATFPPEVRGFRADGTAVAGLDFMAYGSGGYGANVTGGAIDWTTELVTGAGPSPVFGPHVRAFRYAGGIVSSLQKVSFYAYGTTRYGANVAAGDVDGDGFDEIVTGAGPGVVFGPHVRAFDYDGVRLIPIPTVTYFAYGTPRYGVEVSAGDIDGDGFAEMVTGPGPSAAFGPHLRAFDYDGSGVRAIARTSAFVFAGIGMGLNVAAGDLDSDGFDEIACGAGPDPRAGSLLAGLNYDGLVLAPIGPSYMDVFGLSYGLRVAVGGLGY